MIGKYLVRERTWGPQGIGPIRVSGSRSGQTALGSYDEALANIKSWRSTDRNPYTKRAVWHGGKPWAEVRNSAGLVLDVVTGRRATDFWNR